MPRKPRKRRRRFTTQDVAVAIGVVKNDLDTLKRQFRRHVAEEKRESEAVIGFRVHQDDEDEETVPDEVRKR